MKTNTLPLRPLSIGLMSIIILTQPLAIRGAEGLLLRDPFQGSGTVSKPFEKILIDVNNQLENNQKKDRDLLNRLIYFAADTNRSSVERREIIFCIAAMNTDEAYQWLIDNIMLVLGVKLREAGEHTMTAHRICYEALIGIKNWRVVQLILESMRRMNTRDEITWKYSVGACIIGGQGITDMCKVALGKPGLNEMEKENLTLMLEMKR